MIDLFNSLVKAIFDFWVAALNYDVTNEYLMGRLYEQCLYGAWVLVIIVVGIVAVLAYLIYLAIKEATWKRRMLKKLRNK